MRLTTYEFKHCIGAMFEMSTADARKILPSHLQPLEVQHTRSVLAVLAFQFTDSEAGAYDEVVLSVVTPPRVEPGKPLPQAAFYPFMLATSTGAAREHAIERWALPHYMKDLDFSFDEVDGQMKVGVYDDGSPVLELTVTEHSFQGVNYPYHCFMTRGDERLKVNIFMNAAHSQHEEETGELILHPHPMTDPLNIDEVSSYPFREEWYGSGIQTFEEVEQI
ncbi:MAG: hypothetical protein HKO65_03830 [Gemmatimonadetes bacterium]|nr:hypothetical protein [Gemmatimonadota bacterium]